VRNAAPASPKRKLISYTQQQLLLGRLLLLSSVVAPRFTYRVHVWHQKKTRNCTQKAKWHCNGSCNSQFHLLLAVVLVAVDLIHVPIGRELARVEVCYIVSMTPSACEASRSSEYHCERLVSIYGRNGRQACGSRTDPMFRVHHTIWRLLPSSRATGFVQRTRVTATYGPP
jgi:hypothetical protein